MRKMRAVLLGLVLLAGCGDDTAKIRDRGGVYRVTDIDVHPNSESCDRIVVQLTDVETGESFEMSGCGNSGEAVLEKFLPVIGCVAHPEDKQKIEEVPCG